MPNRSSKRPRDLNSLAKFITDVATGEQSQTEILPSDSDNGKDPAAVALGRRGGLKGGKARAEKLTKKRLTAIGKKGATARWGK
jgi:hypothetical protein